MANEKRKSHYEWLKGIQCHCCENNGHFWKDCENKDAGHTRFRSTHRNHGNQPKNKSWHSNKNTMPVDVPQPQISHCRPVPFDIWVKDIECNNCGKKGHIAQCCTNIQHIVASSSSLDLKDDGKSWLPCLFKLQHCPASNCNEEFVHVTF